jgi:hypothetical protein
MQQLAAALDEFERLSHDHSQEGSALLLCYLNRNMPHFAMQVQRLAAALDEFERLSHDHSVPMTCVCSLSRCCCLLSPAGAAAGSSAR